MKETVEDPQWVQRDDGDTDSCAIHVYLGKLTTVDRSLFDTKTGEEMHFSDNNYNRLIGAELI